MNEQAAAKVTPGADDNSTDGRMIGFISIALSPGAIFLEPTIFWLAGFFAGLIGITVAAPKQRYLSIIGVVASVVCFGVGKYLNISIF